MLLETFVAVIALATLMIATDAELAGKGPGAVYGGGLGRFLAVLIGEEHLHFAVTFGAMAFSTFIFDTLDVSTRLGRYVLQELTGRSSRGGAVAATAITAVVPLAFLLVAGEGAYRSFWVLFGTSNQLLAALSLLGISVWLHRTGRPSLFTALPMAFMMTVTLWSLVLQVRTAAAAAFASGPRLDVVSLNGIVSILLIGLAVVLIVEGVKAVLSAARNASSSAPRQGDPAAVRQR
jgi:carbon starvation protein